MKKKEFKKLAKTLTVMVGDQAASANPKEYETGSVGWYINTQLQVALPDGTSVPASFSGNLIVNKSKTMKADDALDGSVKEEKTKEEATEEATESSLLTPARNGAVKV